MKTLQQILFIVFTSLACSAQQASFKGFVYDKNNNPIDSAGIYIVANKHQFVASASTAADGSFSIENVPKGRFEVIAVKEEYMPERVKMKFSKNKLIFCNFSLALRTPKENTNNIQCNFKLLTEPGIENKKVRVGSYAFAGLPCAMENRVRKKLEYIKGKEITLTHDYMNTDVCDICFQKRNIELASIEIKKEDKEALPPKEYVIILFNFIKK